MLLLLGAVLGAGCALVPLVYLLIRVASLEGSEVTGAVLRRQIGPWTLNSALLVAAVAATCLVGGVLIAWLLVCTDLPARSAWLLISAMPLAVPSYVAGFGWLTTVPGLQGFWPTWMVLSAACVPYVVLPTVAALRMADPALLEVARVAGWRPARAWLLGLGPQVLPASAAGTLLAALYALADFGTPALMRHQVLTFAIHRQYGSFVGRDRAAVLALVLVLLAVVLVAAERRLRGRAQRWSVSSGAARRPRPVALGPLRWPALALVALPVVVGVVVPCLGLLRRLALGTRRRLDPAELISAVGSTVLVAVLGGLLALLLAAGVGVLGARRRDRWVGLLETLSFAGHALPGIVVGLSLVYLSLRVVPSLYQSVAVLVFAYGVLFLPKAIGSIRSSVGAVPPVLAQVARTLGRGRLRAGSVTARLAAPGVSAGYLLVVITAMKELPATLMLRPSGFDTLATEMWSRTSGAAQGAAAPYALALVLLASVPAFLLTRDSTWRA